MALTGIQREAVHLLVMLPPEYGIICTYHFEEIFILFIPHVHCKIKQIQS